MRKRKRHPRPAPWLALEWMRTSKRGEARRHYIATAISEVAEYILHSRKGWRKFSRKAER